MVTNNGCPDVCPVCGYLTPGPDPCYFCCPVVAEVLPLSCHSLAGSTDATFASAS